MCGCKKSKNNGNNGQRRAIQGMARTNISAPAPKITPMVSPLSLTGVPRLPPGIRSNDIRRIQRLQQQAIMRNKGRI
jgi:hypothetical protein